MTIGIAPALLLEEVAPAAPPPIDEVAVAIPEVYGTFDTLEAPENAGAPVLAVDEAEDVAFGLRTLVLLVTAGTQHWRFGDILVNNMNNTTSNQNVRCDDLRTVDEKSTISTGMDSNIGTLNCLMACSIH